MPEIKGYKVFDPDWTCRGFQYEVGKTYEHNGPIGICKQGFHFCRKPSDCFQYYQFDPQNKAAEVLATGLVESTEDKSVTNTLTILREIPWAEMLELCNEGNGNSGLRNTGNRNTGFFNTTTPSMYIFNKESNLTREQIESCRGLNVLNWNYENNWWIYSENMSDTEKTNHPEHETTGGYLKTVSLKDACAIMWEALSDTDKKAVIEMPNFYPDIFYEITGIRT